jgi:hypothetical protein
MKLHSQSRRGESLLASRNNVLLFSCICLLLNCFLLVQVEATITVMDTRHRYASRQDHTLGKKLWKGYEYMARLQWIDGNLPLCPENENSGMVHRAPYNLTVPQDGLPVALLVRAGGCSLQAKADFVLQNIHPVGLVKYLIVDGSKRADVIYFPDDQEQQQQQHRGLTMHDDQNQQQADVGVVTSTKQEDRVVDKNNLEKELALYDDDLMDEWIRENYHHKHPEVADAADNNDDEADIPFYLMHVSYRTEFDLLDICLHQDEESKAAGGPRVTIDSRLGTGNLNGTAILWIAVSALLSACACSILLFAHGNQGGWFQEEPATPTPPRPTRRRLTREQVKRLLPRYHYDGHCLQVMEETTTVVAAAAAVGGDDAVTTNELTESQENDGLLSAAAAFVPNPVDLELCSICLDEYEVGDKLRCLPCNHVFHAKCIGRWLAERSATCPLCKTDLWEEEEEDEESQASIVDGHEGTRVAGGDEPILEVQNWLDQLFGVTTERNPVTIVPQPSELPAIADGAPSQQASRQDAVEAAAPQSSSWWRRMFPARPAPVDESAAATLTEPLLQPGDEESPAVPSPSELELGTSTHLLELAETAPQPQEEQESAAAEESVPDPPGHQNRQVTV